MKVENELSPAGRNWLQAFADDEHIIGCRHAAWIGLGPFLEEDLAFCSIAQDELGHAIALYEFLTDDVDAHALLRAPEDQRSCWLVELPCDDWDQALVRHWLYDRAEQLRWQALADSSVPELALLAARAERDESFHRDHAELFLRRLCEGDQHGRDRIRNTIVDLLPVATALWDPVEGEADAIAEGIVSMSSTELSLEWQRRIQDDLDRWGLTIEWPDADLVARHRSDQVGRRVRSPHFAPLQQSLQEVLLIDPSATW